MFNLEAHLKRQIAFSRATFGPGARTEGVLDHMAKEAIEVREEVEKGDTGSPASEWVDLVILALDGLTRQIVQDLHDNGTEREAIVLLAASEVCVMIEEKQGKNEMRVWPDWRTADPNKAIEHDRIGE